MLSKPNRQVFSSGLSGYKLDLYLKLLKYSCEYPVTTALQGALALPAMPWLRVAGATYFKIGNCDSGSTECSTTA